MKHQPQPQHKGGFNHKPKQYNTAYMRQQSQQKERFNHKPKQDNDTYLSLVDVPLYDDEDDEVTVDKDKEEIVRCRGVDKSTSGTWLGFNDKHAKKKEKKELITTQAAEARKQEAIKDDNSVFSIVIGNRGSTEEGAYVKDISIESFSVSVRGKELFKNASLRISHGRRYGLVGPNGTGKSSLLKLIARRQLPIPKNIDILLLEQEVIGDHRSALEVVVSTDEELVKLREDAAHLQQNINFDDDVENLDTTKKLTEIYEKLQEMGSHAAEAHASKILAGLGFSKAMQMQPTNTLSGGWRMRLSLAGALFIQPTLLLLDEPTNHLDLRALLWLEEYLSRWKKTLVMVSHDRDFLNRICTDIIHVDREELHYYKGDFDAFERGYEQKINESRKMQGKQFKKVDHKRIGSRARKKAVKFHFSEPTELPHPLLQLLEVRFSYPGHDESGLKGVDVGIDMGTRVAIVGPNGAGKSTLLKLLAGELQPVQGESRRSPKLRIGRYSQHFVDLLTMDETSVQYLLRLYPDQKSPSKQEAVRAQLGKFGVPSHNHHTPIMKLSGGQKARVVFTAISMAKPHILLLDEPTNHLDMQSIDALADAIDKFSGGVVLVSHDARLISRVCEDEERSEIWVVDDGVITRYPQSFEDYKHDLQTEIRRAIAEGHR